MSSERLVFTEGTNAIGEGMTLTDCRDAEKQYELGSFGLKMKENGVFLPDDFRHEMYLLIRDGERRIIVSGCSHKGALNVKTWFAPDVLIGGFHLMKLDPEKEATRLKFTAMELLRQETVYYTGHCTGEEQYAALKTHLGERLHRLSTGAVFEI